MWESKNWIHFSESFENILEDSCEVFKYSPKLQYSFQICCANRVRSSGISIFYLINVQGFCLVYERMFTYVRFYLRIWESKMKDIIPKATQLLHCNITFEIKEKVQYFDSSKLFRTNLISVGSNVLNVRLFNTPCIKFRSLLRTNGKYKKNKLWYSGWNEGFLEVAAFKKCSLKYYFTLTCVRSSSYMKRSILRSLRSICLTVRANLQYRVDALFWTRSPRILWFNECR